MLHVGKKKKDDVYIINKGANNYKSSNPGSKSLGKNHSQNNSGSTKGGIIKQKQFSQGKNSQKYR